VIDDVGIGVSEGSDDGTHPHIFVGNKESRTVLRNLVGNLVGILVVECPGACDIDPDERSTFRAEVLKFEGGNRPVNVLGNEEQVDHADNACLDLFENATRKGNFVDATATSRDLATLRTNGYRYTVTQDELQFKASFDSFPKGYHSVETLKADFQAIAAANPGKVRLLVFQRFSLGGQ
jgi:hypothetical protein